MTATELQKYLHRTGKYQFKGFSFAVEVIDARYVYTRLEFRIVPLAGEGDSWVMANFVTLDDPVPGEQGKENKIRMPDMRALES